jgi:hypothetical protein
MPASKKARFSFDQRGVSDAALSRVLHQLKRDPTFLEELPNTQSAIRDNIGNRIREDFDGVCVVSKLHGESSKTFVWKRCCPMKLLLRYSTSPSFSEVLFDRLQRYPLPWTAVVYHDEVTPGNALRPANGRKFHAFYLSFLELGLHLRQETSWLPFAMIRSSIVKQVIGGISSVVASLLKESFDCPGGYRCELNVMGRQCLMTAVFGRFLFDESALKSTYNSKGASGLRPCFLCKNVLMKKHSTLDHDVQNYFVDICCGDTSVFDAASDFDVWAQFDSLKNQRGTLRKGKWKDLQKAAGLSLNENGVLREDMRSIVFPISCCTYDSMHTYFQHGVASVEVHLYLSEVSKKGIRFSHIREFAALWERASSKGTALGEILSDVREKLTDDNFKGMAGELLSILPVVMAFHESITSKSAFAPQLKLAGDSLAALFLVVGQLQRLKTLEPVPEGAALELKQLQLDHLAKHKLCYGDSHILPKHHFSLHLEQQLRRDKILIDTFVHERRHKLLKRAGNDACLGSGFEAAVLAHAVQNDLWQLENKHEERNKLLGKTAEWFEVAALLQAESVLVAERMLLDGAVTKIDDIVCVHQDAALILACLQAFVLCCTLNRVFLIYI